MIIKVIRKLFYFFLRCFEILNKSIILKLNKVNFAKSVKIQGFLFLRNDGKIFIADNVKINSGYRFNPIGLKTFTSIVVKQGAKLFIDNGAGLSNVSIVCTSSITIGKNVFIGGDVRLYDTDFHSLNFYERVKGATIDADIKCSPIIIQDGAFIGASCIVLKGVTIGKKSIIGAGSVVTKNIPSGEIWAGNPAKFIRKV